MLLLLLAFGVTNECHHSWNYPGDARQFKRKKAQCAAVEMALLPIKQAAAAHERLYPCKEPPLCRGSSGWEVNARGCSESCVSWKMSWCLPLCRNLCCFLFHSHVPQEYLWEIWSPVMGEIAAVLVNCVEQRSLKSSSRPGSLH